MEWYTRNGSWSQIASAAIAALAFIVGIGTLLVTWGNYDAGKAATQNKIAVEAVFEWNKHQAVNSRQCLALMAALDSETWDEMFDRRAITIREDLSRQTVACFSDKGDDEIEKLFKRAQGVLTTPGVAALANRVNEILGADNLVASFVIAGIGNPAILAPIARAICRDDRPIMEKLDKSKNLRTSFGSIRALLSPPYEAAFCPK